MAEEQKKQETLLIAKDHVAPLITQFGMVRNELAPLFDLPPASAASAKAAVTWWQGRNAEQQYIYRDALAALASPLIIADIGVNINNESLINTHAVIPSMRWNDPVFLLATDKANKQLRIERLIQGDLLLNTMLLYVQGGAPLYEMDMKFEILFEDFVVLLGLVDLRQRLRFRALLDHRPYDTAMKMEDIEASVKEAFASLDPRWILAFFLPAFHTSPEKFHGDTIRLAVDHLAKIGLLKSAGGNLFAFTEAGERFAESVDKRISSIRIDAYGVGSNGHQGRQTMLLIRGESLLWYAGLSGKNGETVIVAVLSLEKAEALLKEAFSPVAVPKPLAPLPTPQTEPPVQPQSSGGPVTCPKCGTAIKPGKKFCSSCGVKVS